MEKERVLAYTKAKVLSTEDLEQVSGGGEGKGFHWSHKGSWGGSAGSGMPTEVHIDTTVDF